MMFNNLYVPPAENSTAMWAQIKFQYAQYLKEKEQLEKMRRNNQIELEKLKEKKKTIHNAGKNIEQIQEKTRFVYGKMKQLSGKLHNLEVETLKATASTTISDEEKEVLKHFILVEFGDDLARILKHQIISKNRCTFEKELKYIVEQLEMGEIEKIFKALLVDVQDRLKRLMKSTKKSVNEQEKTFDDTFLLVDLYDYFAPTKFKIIKDSNEDLAGDSNEDEELDDVEDDIPDADTYEQFLDIMDKEMSKSWEIFRKLSEYYKKLNKMEKLLLHQRLKQMKKQADSQSSWTTSTGSSMKSTQSSR
uniref:Uncharacterized protein n=1 Tax=Cacopsylla melanoneura TaxID=428564 RepID=A0A8D8M753_9HEMI